MEQSVFLTLFNHPSSFDQRNKLFFPLFLWRKEKRQKKHPPLSVLPLYGEAQLKIADTANFQVHKSKIGHQSPIFTIFVGLRQNSNAYPRETPRPFRGGVSEARGGVSLYFSFFTVFTNFFEGAASP